ncbi:MAG: protoporphyrinogen oxidase [Armatimonadota bacterium]|nr:protoporphyrinogen oxidase [Armatimonadota bacterium]
MSDAPPPSPHVLVVGGGITGLAAAYTLVTDPRAKCLGVACTVIESEPRLGGKLRTERIDGCLVEHGPDSFLATKPWAAELCRALGIGDRLIPTLPGRAVYVASRGRLHPLPDGLTFGVPTRLRSLLGTKLLSPLEKLRVAADLVLPRRRDDSDESLGGLLRRRLGDAVVRRVAGPLLGGIYAGDPDQLSARATFPLLPQWEASHRSLVLAALDRRRQAASTPNGPMFLSLAGGVGELVEHLRAALAGVTLLTGRTVVHLARRRHGGQGYHVRLDDGQTLDADAVVLTVPAFAAAALLAPLSRPVVAALRTIPYVSTAAVTLAYDRDRIRHPLDGHGFVVARDEPLAIVACTWLSSKWPHRAPPNRALLRCYLGAAGREAVVDEPDERLVALARADLAKTMGIDAAPRFAVVARWPKAMPQYPPGHLERLQAMEAGLASLPGLALAGAGYRGIGIPDCIRQGTEAARRVLDNLAGRVPQATWL